MTIKQIILTFAILLFASVLLTWPVAFIMLFIFLLDGGDVKVKPNKPTNIV